MVYPKILCSHPSYLSKQHQNQLISTCVGSNQDRECGSGPTEYGDSLHHGLRMVSTWLLNDLFRYQLGNTSQNQTEYYDLKPFFSVEYYHAMILFIADLFISLIFNIKR